jgi:multiple sugar transport system ATP-binding protein
MATVELRHVWKRFGPVLAVQDFSLATADGEFIVLVGPSGCGKTSTMRMIAGLETVSEGEVLFDGKDVTDQLPHDRDVAMVFQNYALFPHLNVYANIAFGMRLRKVPREEVDARVKRAAQMLGIQDVLDRRPRELSGGQRQRVALGRAIVREPRVFLMDEPLSNLDAALRMEMRSELIKLQDRLGVTTFYVTHDQIEALSMGDRIVVMRHGKIQQIGAPTELYERPSNAYVASFIGSPPINILPGEMSGEALQLRAEGIGLRLSGAALRAAAEAKEGRLLLGVRPEHLRLGDAAIGEGELALQGKVDTVEPLGSTTLVRVALPSGRDLNVLVGEKVRLAMGDVVFASFRAQDIYLFDESDERSLLGLAG